MKTAEQKHAAKLKKLRKAMNSIIKKREEIARCEKCRTGKAIHLVSDKLMCTDCYSALCDHIYDEVRELK